MIPDARQPTVARPASLRIAALLVGYVLFDGLNSGLTDFTLSSFASVSALATFLAAALVLASPEGRDAARRSVTPLHVVLALWVVYLTGSGVLSGGSYDLALAKNLVLFVVIASLASEEHALRTLVVSAAAAGALQAGLGIAQVLRDRGVGPDGIAGELPNHVQFALYLLLALLLLLPFVMCAQGKQRWAIVCLAAVEGVVLVGSQARGVVLIGGVMAVAWVLTAVGNRRARAIMIAVLAAAATGAMALSSRLRTLLMVPKAFGDVDKLNELLSGRLPLLYSAWAMFLEHPVFGVGYGRYGELWAQYIPASMTLRATLSQEWLAKEMAAHSTYLQVAAETGAVGLMLYLLLIALGIVYALRAVRSLLKERGFAGLSALAVLLGIVAISLHGVLDNSGWHDRVYYILLGLSAALSSGLRCAREVLE